MREGRWMVVALAMLAVPLPADAQVGASIAGVVKDAQGAVMPGVTVEATSPVLIEKVRSAVSDGTGRFEIPNLRPGVYTVMFTLTGFSTVKREGIELTGTAVVAVDAEMRIGAVTETITVSGETPIVDVQSTRRQTVMDEAVVTAIPTSRNGFAVSVLIPGVVLATGGNANQDVGGALGPTTLSIAAHGSRLHDQKLTVNGVSLSTMIGGGWGGGAVPNATGTSEFAIDTAAVDASLATGGPRINFIPKDGGNRVSGTIFGSFANAGMQTNSTRTEGVTGPIPTPLRADTVKTNADFNPGVGGPFVRDKVWFYFSGRFQKADVYVPGMYHNQAANDPSVFVYVPDTSRPATGPREFQVYQGRVTYQANPRNKFGLTYDLESNCFCPDTTPGGVSATRTPESGTDRRFPLQRFVQIDWNSPLSSKILLEASGIHRVERWGAMHLQTGSGDNIESLNPAMVGISDTGLAPPPGFIYRAATGGAGNVPPYNNSWNVNVHYRAALSYITGSHAFKVGFNNAWGHHENSVYGVQPYLYNFLNGKPTGLTVQATPYTDEIDVDRDLGIFAQDKWTTGKWTLSGGIRYDNFKNSFPAQALVAGPLVPNRVANYPEIQNINWNDITPKMGASYDLFGNGKTALKVTLNKYLMGYGTNGFFENGLSSRLNPILRLVTNTTRSWNDSFYGASDPRTANFTPDCPAGLAGPPSGECGPLANPNFGTLNQALVDPGPQLLEGWGKRQYNWEFSTGVQHEILPRVSLDVSYFRRWYGNFQVEDDLSVTPADYDKFNFVVPTDKNLPGGGGYTLTAYDLKAGRPPEKNRLTLSDEYGKMIDHWNGVDVVVNARLQNGFVIQGGVSTGRRVADNCDIIDDLPELEQTLYGPNATPPLGGTNTRVFVFGATPIDFCHRDERFLTQMKALGAYTIPKIDVQFAGTFQSLPGPIIEANYNNFSTGTLGRPYGTGPFRAFQIVEPGALFGERLNEFDFRISKIFKVGRTRTNINFDLYNLFNADTALTENFAYGAPWRRPTSILQSRFIKIGAQFDF